MPKQSISEILSERGSRYGSFKDHAELAQQLKLVVSSHEGYPGLNSSQAEAMEMILHKVARIINGDPNYDDSWHDIAGYAQLVVDQLHGKDT